MTDTNPENKIDDCPTPVDGVVITPHSHTSRNKVNQTSEFLKELGGKSITLIREPV